MCLYLWLTFRNATLTRLRVVTRSDLEHELIQRREMRIFEDKKRTVDFQMRGGPYNELDRLKNPHLVDWKQAAEVARGLQRRNEIAGKCPCGIFWKRAGNKRRG